MSGLPRFKQIPNTSNYMRKSESTESPPIKIEGDDDGEPPLEQESDPPIKEESDSDQGLGAFSGEAQAGGLGRGGPQTNRPSANASDETTLGLVTEIQGDLFDARDGAALIREFISFLCPWKYAIGMVIANTHLTQMLAIAKYPASFRIYKAHCDKYKQKTDAYYDIDPPEEAVSVSTGRAVRHPRTRVQLPEGTALIIEPQQEDYDNESQKRKHWIICLFTSRGYGKNVDNPDTVIQNTELAITNLEQQLAELEMKQRQPGGVGITELRACRLNSGNFDVPWDRTKRILENSSRNFTVVYRT
ncbi:hypothetical protein BDV06DRAFT_220268 [Aspergillus oleicola]